ncbi:hypothetical protein VB636_09935, partial [Paracoccus sp. APAP_BH8]
LASLPHSSLQQLQQNVPRRGPSAAAASPSPAPRSRWRARSWTPARPRRIGQHLGHAARHRGSRIGGGDARADQRHANMTEAEKAAFGEAVRDYLMANPDVLNQSGSAMRTSAEMRQIVDIFVQSL